MTGTVRNGAYARDASTTRDVEPSRLQQWWVLTSRSILPTLRNGELVTQIAASIMFTVGFYIPLKKIGMLSLIHI